MAPYSDFTTGEYKDWYPFAIGAPTDTGGMANMPPEFPLVSMTYSILNYRIWSDRARWKER